MNDATQILPAVLAELAQDCATLATADAPLQCAAFAVQRHLGAARVRIYLLPLELGTEPRGGALVHVGDSAAAGRSPAVPIERLDAAEHGVVLGDLRPFHARAIDARLQIRIRVPWAIAWLLLEPAGAAHDQTAAVVVAEAVLHVIAAEHRQHAAIGRRRQFYDELLALRARRYEHVQRSICELWCRTLGAEWAWLWTYNQAAQIYELAAEGTAEPHAEPRAGLLGEPRTPRGRDRGIGHFACRAQQPVYADDLAGWQAQDASGVAYTVLLATAMQNAGTGAALYLPLRRTGGGAASRGAGSADQGSGGAEPGPAMSPVLGLYWRKGPIPRRQPDPTLMAMAQWSAHVLAYEEAAKRQRIQTNLVSLAQEDLTRTGSNPRQIRDQYLTDLMRVIGGSLHASGITIFLQARFAEHIHCIASTGLEDAHGHRIEPRDHPAVRYEPGAGLTGTCLAANRTILSPTIETEGHVGRYRETRRDASSDVSRDVDPLLMVPIPRYAAKPELGAIGVIRVTEHRSPLLPMRLSHFREEDAKTLAFIAAQISPILQTLNVRIDREETVAVIRHDLLTPLGMIRDVTQNLREQIEKGKPVRDIDLANIEVCAYRAMNLGQDLGYDKIAAEELQPVPTLLEGDLVARIKAMLSHMAAGKGMRLHFTDTFRAIPPLHIDPPLIERALGNLVVNAVKYGHPNTTIEIEASAPATNPRFFLVTVANHGIGIPERERELIFLPNYRSELAKRTSGPSVGLGLSIARHIMRLHGGDVAVTALDRPTVLTLYFPKSLAHHGPRPAA